MLTTIPGNRLESLTDALATVLNTDSSDPLQTTQIMVQHPGMQHWLSMELAKQDRHGICMNLAFPMPVEQFWNLIRSILGDAVPVRSPFRRELMAWRIDRILLSAEVIADDRFEQPTRYWQRQSDSQQTLSRFQLAEQISDLFEQYLLFRPDWIESWDAGQDDHWQAALWRLLVKDIAQSDEIGSDHPVKLAKQALANAGSPAEPLPERLYLFGINSLPPFWIQFIKALSDVAGVDVLIFHLNPSNEYWGDVTSTKVAAKRRAAWIELNGEDVDLSLEVGNPLLANLGQQGQAFVKLLSDVADDEIPMFEEPGTDTLLSRLQYDIAKMEDGRSAPSDVRDSSVFVTSAHSPFREVQGLHDWLLHQFNANPELTPKDVLVMCPNVEDYAPFVESIFSRLFDELGDNHPKLPCSVADRSLVDSDPTVSAFLDLLTLPDSRFQVRQVIAWLRTPAIQAQFQFAPADIRLLSNWLESASVHWGLDAEHKNAIIEGPGQATAQYTWAQGLDRLLMGFAYADEEVLIGNSLLLPDVEGSNALALGRFMQFLDELKSLSRDLVRTRTAVEWQAFLQDRMRLALFATSQEFETAHDDIANALLNLGEDCLMAGFEGQIPLSVVRHWLRQTFSSPKRTGRNFMTGQITVASMVPMRSVPFKVVAILGLNDGEFPRSRPPLGFDLMAKSGGRLGDRSTRGDDRYLFLEAMFSARENLYLSYQGHDKSKNTKRQPSPVLTELMDYMEAATGWQKCDVFELPLQPFNPANYSGRFSSFDDRWIRLSKEHQNPMAPVALPGPDMSGPVSVHELVSAFDHPARAFCRTRLGLVLDKDHRPELDDAEPFETCHLDRYGFQSQVLDCAFGASDRPVSELSAYAMASGKLPDNPMTAGLLDDWQRQAVNFAGQVKASGFDQVTHQRVTVTCNGLTVEAQLPFSPDGTLTAWRLADPKGKDYITLWINHLVANMSAPTTSTGYYRGKSEDTVKTVTLEPVLDAESQLAQWIEFYKEILCQPLPCNAVFGMEIIKPRPKSQYSEFHFEALWNGNAGHGGMAGDPYLMLFWPELPDHDQMYRYLAPLFAQIDRARQLEEIEVA